MANRGATGNSSTYQTNTKATDPAVADQPQPGDPATSSSSVAPRVDVVRINPGTVAVAKSQLKQGANHGDFWGAAVTTWTQGITGGFFSGNKSYVVTDTPAPSLESKGKTVHNVRIETPAGYNLRLRAQAEQDIFDKAKLTGDYSTFLDVVGAPIQWKPDGAGGGNVFDGISDFLNGLTSGAGGKYSTYIIIAVVVIVLILILKR